ncbi:MAG: hypothetical protein SGI86_13420 [Deltaproteobacteria bacterium]|nr:hypothetical protein [Deltaproteobacteria bacterium]
MIVASALIRSIRIGLAVVAAGIALQLACALFFSPATFVISAGVGVPLVLVGAFIFGRAATRVIPPPVVESPNPSVPHDRG